MNNNVITISGSMRFYEDMIRVGEELSMNGNIVLLPFKDHNGANMTDEVMKMHIELHERRIDMSDKLFVVNKDGYIGEQVRHEIIYTMKNHKPVEFMGRFDSKKWREQWGYILNEIDNSHIILSIAPTANIMIEKLVIAIRKFAKLQTDDKFNFIDACTEIHEIQMILLMLFESVVIRLKAIFFDTALGECQYAFDYICNEIITDITIDTLIYSTASELIELFIENKKL